MKKLSSPKENGKATIASAFNKSKKKVRLLSFFTIPIITIMVQFSCSIEEPLAEQKIIPVEFATAEQVLNELSDPKIKETIRNYTSQNAMLERDGDENLDPYFEKIVMEDYTNYSLYLKKYTDSEPFFLYLLITKDNNLMEKAGYLKYIPMSPSEDFNIKTFSGTMQLLDTNFQVAAESHFDAGTIQNSMPIGTEVCTTIIRLLEVPCSNGGGHGVGETCQPPFENDAYFSLTIDTSCFIQFNYHHVPGAFVGGGGGASVSNKQRFLNGLSDGQRAFLTIHTTISDRIIHYLEIKTYAAGRTNAVEMINLIIDYFGEYGESSTTKSVAEDFVDSITNIEDELEDGDELATPPDCESFNFVSTGGNWQEAAVANIHFIVVVISPQGVYVNQVIECPQAMLFGVPKNLAVGNTSISPGLAANMSATVLNKTIREVVHKYGNKSVSGLIVLQFFKERLKHNFSMYIPGGRVQTNPTTYSVTPTQYQTNAFGLGDCD
jgi:hypothetical protein